MMSGVFLRFFFFLYSHFVSFYFFVIIVTGPENCVGKCWMICDNKRNMQRPLTSVSGMMGQQPRTTRRPMQDIKEPDRCHEKLNGQEE